MGVMGSMTGIAFKELHRHPKMLDEKYKIKNMLFFNKCMGINTRYKYINTNTRELMGFLVGSTPAPFYFPLSSNIFLLFYII